MRLYDLSVDGCMVVTLGGKAKARDAIGITFEEGIEAQGEVVWATGGYAGIRFCDPLHPVIVQYLGYRQPAASFASKVPCDAFGRVLPNLPGTLDPSGPSTAA